MAKTNPTTKPDADDLAVVERLVDEGKLIAVPPGGVAKPRRVAAVALHDGGELLLYLSRATTPITDSGGRHDDETRPARVQNHRRHCK